MGNSSGWFCDWRIGYGKPYEHLVCGRIADCAACSSHRSAPPVVQLIVFLLVSLCMLAATRPWANKYINSRTQSTNADRIIGESIRIAERVSNLDQTGMAVVHGQEWTVRTRDDNVTIEAGELARVLEISGVKLIVEKE